MRLGNSKGLHRRMVLQALANAEPPERKQVNERAEKAAVIVTSNLPFSEWTSVIPNTRL